MRRKMRSRKSAQALATWEASCACAAADDQIEAERSACSTRPRSGCASSAAAASSSGCASSAAEEDGPWLTGWRLRESEERRRRERKELRWRAPRCSALGVIWQHWRGKCICIP